MKNRKGKGLNTENEKNKWRGGGKIEMVVVGRKGQKGKTKKGKTDRKD